MDFINGQGISGQKANGYPCMTRKGAPTTATRARVGVLYMDTDTGDLYKCIAVADGVYTWVAVDAAAAGGSLPAVSESDNGKILTVVGGVWAAAELPKYDGAYSVTPDADEDQILSTAQTYVDADIKIEKIPYSEVSNTSGGVTVNIGG